MKTILHIAMSLIAAATLTLTSCSEANPIMSVGDHSVSFARAAFFLPAQGTGNVVVQLTQPAEHDITIPLILGGTAQEGTDYTVSTHQITIPAGQKSASLTFTSIGSMDYKQIDLTLGEAPQGYDFGFYRHAVMTIAPRPVLTATWPVQEYNLKTTLAIALELYNGVRKYTYPNSPVEVPVEIDASSTAKIGEHFEFTNGKSVLRMTSSDATAKATLRILKKEAGHDKLVLRIAESPYFLAGAQNRVIINLQGATDPNKLAGTWKLNALSNAAAIRSAAALLTMAQDADNIPVNCLPGDKITLTRRADGRFALDTSLLGGDLAKYLRTTMLTLISEAEENLWETDYNNPEKAYVLTLRAEKVNRFFNATQVNEQPANIDMRLLNNERTLEVRIYQYEPKDFLQLSYQYKATDVYTTGDIMKRGFTLIYRFTKE